MSEEESSVSWGRTNNSIRIAESSRWAIQNPNRMYGFSMNSPLVKGPLEGGLKPV